MKKRIDNLRESVYNNSRSQVADVAHPVERHLAKVEVASSSLVIRSILKAKDTFPWKGVLCF